MATTNQNQVAPAAKGGGNSADSGSVAKGGLQVLGTCALILVVMRFLTRTPRK